jgi:hypothetical protein
MPFYSRRQKICLVKAHAELNVSVYFGLVQTTPAGTPVIFQNKFGSASKLVL